MWRSTWLLSNANACFYLKLGKNNVHLYSLPSLYHTHTHTFSQMQMEVISLFYLNWRISWQCFLALVVIVDLVDIYHLFFACRVESSMSLKIYYYYYYYYYYYRYYTREMYDTFDNSVLRFRDITDLFYFFSENVISKIIKLFSFHLALMFTIFIIINYFIVINLYKLFKISQSLSLLESIYAILH